MLLDNVVHSEHSEPAPRNSGTRKVWKRLTARGRELSAECGVAARAVAAVIGAHFRAKHQGKAAEHVAADYGVTDRQARRWLKTGPTFPVFCQMLKREGARFREAVAAAFAAPDRPRRRRFRWGRAS